MEFFQLRSFICVARNGSITRAAEELFLTQPAVTQHIRALEKELGVSLFDRTGRGVALTDAGEALLDYARRSTAILDEGKQVIGDLQTGKTGRLTLGAGVTTCIFHLPEQLRTFRKLHPGIDVVVRTGRSREVAAMVLEREIDLGFVTTAVEHSDVSVTALYEEEIALVGPPDSPQRIVAEELDNHPLILFPQGTGFRDYLDREFDKAGVRPDVKMETDSAEAIKSFVSVGLGMSYLPVSAVEAEVAAGAVSRVKVKGLPKLNRETSIVYRTDRRLSAASHGFLEVLGAGQGSEAS